jgi:xanthosine phosphorylase
VTAAVAALDAAALLRDRFPGGAEPSVGIVLGSGLGAVAEAVVGAVAVGYDELAGFPRPSVEGHRGRAVLGERGGVPVTVLEGRAHLYEGAGMAELAVPIRALRAAGARTVLLTNAAGALRGDLRPGRLMLIADHINLTGTNPLVGPNDDAVGPRFPSLRDAYDPALRATLRDAARRLGIALAEGVYLAVSGPSFETPAEVRAFRALGADAVGMSTVHEAIVARHCGLRVAALSAIANLAEGLSGEPVSHDQTLRDAARTAGDLARLLEDALGALVAA